MNKNSLNYYMNTLTTFPLITREEENKLSEKIQDGCEESFDKLFCSNLKLVVSIAKDYHTSRIDIMDLIAEGNLGLRIAVTKFKSGSSKFSTYASYWIKQKMFHFIYRNRTIIRIPIDSLRKMQNINIAQNELYYTLNRKPTLKELSQKTGLGEQSIKNHLKHQLSEQSIQAVQSKEGCVNIEIADSNPTPQYHDTIKNEVSVEMMNAISKMDERKRKLIKIIFGIKPYKKRTRKQCEQIFEVSRERVRQLEMEAIRELKLHCLNEGLDNV